MNKFHIYVPSRGRASNCLTAKLLQESGLRFTVVVEPQEYEEYVEHFTSKNVHRLKRNDRGLPYARNSILKLSRSRGEKAHWQMDDDIRKFMIRVNDKNLKVDAATSVENIERLFLSYRNLAVIAHRYASFAFSQKQELSYNQNPCSSILLRNDLDAKWRKGTVDDADFALQVLSSGWSTIIANRQIIDTVPHNKQKGGLTDEHPQEDGRRARFIQLAKDWPGAFSVTTDKNGRAKLQHRRIWSSFEQRPIRKKK